MSKFIQLKVRRWRDDMPHDHEMCINVNCIETIINNTDLEYVEVHTRDEVYCVLNDYTDILIDLFK